MVLGHLAISFQPLIDKRNNLRKALIYLLFQFGLSLFQSSLSFCQLLRLSKQKLDVIALGG